MYEYIEGRLSMRAAARLVLDVGGVGYDLLVPVGARFGEEAVCRAYVHLVVRDDAHTLYGFPDLELRDLFRTLLKVRGVGPTMALGILSALPGNELVAAIHGGDRARLCSVKGVGKKTAEQILLDLGDKLGPPTGETRSMDAAPSAQHSNLTDAVSALVSIGYKDKDAEKAASKAAEQVGLDDVDALIRAALALR